MLYPIKVKEKYGYINHKGRIVVEPMYYYASPFENGTGWIDTQSDHLDFGDTYKVYFVNAQGHKILSLELHKVSIGRRETGALSKGFVKVEIPSEGYQYYGMDGKPAFTNVYKRALDFSHGLAAVQINDKWGYINRKGEMVISDSFDFAGRFFSDNNAVVLSEKKWGVIDRSGQFLVVPKYKMLYEATDTPFLLAFLPEEEKNPWRYIDIHDRQIFSETFKGAGCFQEGLACVRDDNRKYGFINTKGNLVIPYLFDDALGFSEGLACVKIDGLWGYINRSGKIVISPQFGWADSFRGSLAEVKIGGSGAYVEAGEEYGYINKAGRFVWKAVREDDEEE